MTEGQTRSGSGEELIEFSKTILRRWKLVVIVVGFCAMVGVGVSFLQTPVYEAEVTLLPRVDNGPSGIFGSMLNMSMLSMLSNQGNELLYYNILVSDSVLMELVKHDWPTKDSDTPKSLFEIFEIEFDGDDPLEDRVATTQMRNILRYGVVGMNRDKLTGFMQIRARVPRDPELAAALANEVVKLLDRFNVGISTSRAGEKRQFLNKSLQEVKRELEAQEMELVEFVKENRSFGKSPLLLQQHQRLEREVDATTAVWVELRRQLEMSRMEEQQELSSIDVLDWATIPIYPVEPNMVLNFLIGLCLGSAFALAIIVFGFARTRGWL